MTQTTPIQHLARVCPLLERESATTRLPYAPDPWVLLQCRETQFVYLANPPAYDAYQDDFAWEKSERQEAAARQAAEPLLYALSTSVTKFRLHVIKRNKFVRLALPFAHRVCEHHARWQMLDIGCGQGKISAAVLHGLPDHLRARCIPSGIEIATDTAAIAHGVLARYGGGCLQDAAIAGLTRFPPEHFHLILMCSFLEHEINPLPVLRQCRRQLAPEGRIVVKVPNYGSLNRVVRGARWCGFRWPDHVNYFTAATLTALANRAGYAIERMYFQDRQPFSDSLYAVLVRDDVAHQ